MVCLNEPLAVALLDAQGFLHDNSAGLTEIVTTLGDLLNEHSPDWRTNGWEEKRKEALGDLDAMATELERDPRSSAMKLSSWREAPGLEAHRQEGDQEYNERNREVAKARRRILQVLEHFEAVANKAHR